MSDTIFLFKVVIKKFVSEFFMDKFVVIFITYFFPSIFQMERPSPKSAKMGPASMQKHGVKFDEQQFGPHVIKMGQYDDDMLDRVVQKYKKMGHSVQQKQQIIKLNLIKATTCLQEEMMATYTDHMDHSDITLVSSAGQAIPCHR